MTPHRLVRLYPRAWRERYGDEFAALLDATPLTWRVRVDLVRGAAREWVHEVLHPRRWTASRRMAWRAGGRLLVALAFSLTIVTVSRALAPYYSELSLSWPVWGAVGATYIGFFVRTIHAAIKSGLWKSAAYKNPRLLRSTISYREFGLWLVAALVVAPLVTSDGSRAWMSSFSAFWTWFLWFDWLYATTPAQIRYVRIERRLMLRTDIMAPAIARYERKRAENADRLMRFYGRVPPLPSLFVGATPERERT